MDSIHWILILFVSSLAPISQQSDLMSSEASVVSQWMAPPQSPQKTIVSPDNQVGKLRRASLNLNNQPSQTPNSTILRNVVSLPSFNLSSEYAPPYAGPDYKPDLTKESGLRRFHYMGTTHTNNTSLRSHYGYYPGAGRVYNTGVPPTAPIVPSVVQMGIPNGLPTALTIAVFKSDKCDGTEKADYTVHMVFNKNKLCNRYAIFGDELCSRNTIKSVVQGKTDVGKFSVLFILTEDKAGHKNIFVFGYIYTGSQQGRYLQLQIIYDQYQIAQRCVGVYGSASIQSDTTTLRIMELNEVQAIDCWKVPQFCPDKTKAQAKSTCLGSAITS